MCERVVCDLCVSKLCVSGRRKEAGGGADGSGGGHAMRRLSHGHTDTRLLLARIQQGNCKLPATFKPSVALRFCLRFGNVLP